MSSYISEECKEYQLHLHPQETRPSLAKLQVVWLSRRLARLSRVLVWSWQQYQRLLKTMWYLGTS